ncbi:MAG: protein kinase [Candidatus Eremiobacteraeota bacterium]|nr:protein kinase [Candidatus Eremiobacteraeota bacterium]
MGTVDAKLIGTRYTILDTIKESEKGYIYIARDRQISKRVVAIKKIKQDPSSPTPSRWISYFMKKAKALSTIHAEGFPEIYHYFFDDDYAYLVMKWIKGKNLEEIMVEKNGGIPFFNAINWMKKISIVLKILHRHNPPIAHTDIRPGNIIIPYPGKLVLVGLEMPELALSKPGHDTPLNREFSAPEVLQGDFCPQSDIYSLSVLGYYLLTGIRPGEFPPFCLPPIQKMNPDIPDILAAIISRGLERDKSLRYKNGEEIFFDLEQCLQTISTESIFSYQYPCPNCKKVLVSGGHICPDCNIETGIYEGSDDPESFFKKGIMLIRKGEVKSAERRFYQSVRLGMENIELSIRIAMCEYMSGHRDRALRMLENIQSCNRLSPLPLLAKAQIHCESAETKKYNKLIQEIEKKFPDSPPVLIHLAKIKFDREEFEEANKLVDSALKIDIKNREAREMKVKILWRAGKDIEMLDFLKKIDRSERTALMECYMVLYYNKLGKEDQAINPLEASVTKDPENYEPRLALARIYSKTDNHDKALKNYRHALSLSEGDLDILREYMEFLAKKKLDVEINMYKEYLKRISGKVCKLSF